MTTSGPIVREPLVFSLLLLLVGCGASPTSNEVPVSSGPSGQSRESAIQRCARDGPDGARTDYAFIASYECSDGSVPLGGDATRGADARLGNVGQGPDGHVIDRYRVPCPSGAVEIYVDAYHCGPGIDVEIDPNNLRPEQLRMMATNMRALESVAFDHRAQELRRSLLEWLRGSPQVHLSICNAVIEDVVHDGYLYRELVLSQFILSMGAAVIELGDGPEHANRVALAAVSGALRMHDAIVSVRGQDAVDPQLRDLARLSPGELETHVTTLASNCQEPPPVGMMMSTEDGSVWPPSGPSCDRFVRCCESHGLIRNGVAVTGTAGLMCLLAAAPPDVDCAGGLAMLAVQGVSCPP